MAGSPPWLTLSLAVLNVGQVVLLAHISARSTRVRRTDPTARPGPQEGSSPFLPGVDDA